MCGEKSNLINNQKKAHHSRTQIAIRGFSLAELVITIAVAAILTAIAVPLVSSTWSYFKIRSSAAAIDGIIQSTRYQAIFQGCQTAVVFASATQTAQKQTSQAAGGGCNGVLVPLCGNLPSAAPCPIPLSATSATLTPDTVIIFSPRGAVQSPQAVGGQTTLTLTLGGRRATIAVSSAGGTHVTYM